MTIDTTLDGFVHPALFYRSDDEYLAALVPFVSDGVAAGQPVAVAVPGPRLSVLRAALSGVADRVTMIDMAEAGRNPGRIIAGVLRRFADEHPGTHVRIIGEPIWPGRTADEYPACAQHEALINAAFTGRDLTIVCPYDVVGLDPHVVADARVTHPLVWEADSRYPSDDYAPERVIAHYNQPLDGRADAVAMTVTEVNQITEARRFTTAHARALGLAEERVADLELIATELVTNSLIHATGSCVLRLWRHGDHLVCEVRDAGHLSDPLAGRRPAPGDQPFGRGLLLVNELADLVRAHTTPTGTTLRALLRLVR
ncbi:sensor histidine kinase [Actinokineospora fastidiosa]|uniref:Anti-sigma regulatory factor n=1 Tax=Actinokineospora fastidiosa TaxID=1816 RepID=A0A918GI56_9PSEU|nr:sensor histidine kinase [Actinokineospora fastidiosa]GGS36833.1 anti-sigma regulatory factor [Actinokineospora fastidiosa]